MNNGVFCGPCCHCKSQMWLPQALYEAANHGREKIAFYCAYGHGQVFSKGDSELDVVRRERDRAWQQLAEKDDAIKRQKEQTDFALRQIGQMKSAATKAKKRTIAGTCPCCHRTFRQMALHIKNQHPEFKAEAVT